MNSKNQRRELDRRSFIASAALLAGAAFASQPVVEAQLSSELRYKIIGFSKPFQNLKPEAVAATVEEVGWDGIECPVRPKGHIEPAKAEDELPALVAALKRSKKEIGLLATNITKATDPGAEKLLKLAAGLGIKRWRLGSQTYDPKRAIPAQLNEIAAQLADLAALNKELGLQAGFQNHSGADQVGAAVWDVWSMIKDVEPKQMGVCFDIGHAALEGGLSWPSTARLMQPHFCAVLVKDFYWAHDAKGWSPAWVPLGEGIVNPSFFKWLKSTSFSGPISQHHEYEVGEGKLMTTAMRQDLKVLRKWLAA